MSCDTAFTRIAKPADEVFAFMSDVNRLGSWALGSWNGTVDETGLIRARSIKDGSPICVRIEAHPEMRLIDYHVGSDPEHLVPRIFARIVEGSTFGAPNNECGLMMSALRTEDMDDARWELLIATHRVEVDMIRAMIESGYDHRSA